MERPSDYLSTVTIPVLKEQVVSEFRDILRGLPEQERGKKLAGSHPLDKAAENMRFVDGLGATAAFDRLMQRTKLAGISSESVRGVRSNPFALVEFRPRSPYRRLHNFYCVQEYPVNFYVSTSLELNYALARHNPHPFTAYLIFPLLDIGGIKVADEDLRDLWQVDKNPAWNQELITHFANHSKRDIVQKIIKAVGKLK